MNILSEEISSAWPETIKTGSKRRCYSNNDALSCVMNFLSARKDGNQNRYGKRLLWYAFIENTLPALMVLSC